MAPLRNTSTSAIMKQQSGRKSPHCCRRLAAAGGGNRGSEEEKGGGSEEADNPGGAATSCLTTRPRAPHTVTLLHLCRVVEGGWGWGDGVRAVHPHPPPALPQAPFSHSCLWFESWTLPRSVNREGASGRFREVPLVCVCVCVGGLFVCVISSNSILPRIVWNLNIVIKTGHGSSYSANNWLKGYQMWCMWSHDQFTTSENGVLCLKK